MDQPTILIVTDDAEFSRSVTGCWHASPGKPAFTLMTGDLCHSLAADAFDVAVVGTVHPKALAKVLRELEATGKPVIVAANSGESLPATVKDSSRMVIHKREGWLETLIVLAEEALRHSAAEIRAAKAEKAGAALEVQAALGRYMLETRHSLNNALTSVLGNSELLLLESSSLSPAESSQVETIRNMALRMHEILQRFSSLDKEFSVLEKQAEKDGRKRAKAATAGS